MGKKITPSRRVRNEISEMLSNAGIEALCRKAGLNRQEVMR